MHFQSFPPGGGHLRTGTGNRWNRSVIVIAIEVKRFCD